MKTNRSLLTLILLSIVTFGIYALYFWSKYAEDMNIVCNGDGKHTRGILARIIFSILTLGIYAMIWVHRTTRFLNQRIWPKMEHPVRHVLLCAIVPFYLIWWLCKNDAARDPDQSPAHQVAGCLFVPFYFTYWLYKNARRTDALARSRGMESNIAILCLVLGIFAPVVSMVVLQDRLNAILLPADYLAVSREAPVVPTAPAAPAGDNPDDLPEF